MKLGRHHPTVKRLRALRRDGAQRAAESVLLAEGLHLAEEALRCSVSVELAVFAAPLLEAEPGRRLLKRLEARGVACLEVSDAVLGSLQDARSPQPLLLVVQRPEGSEASVLGAPDGPALIAVAVGVQDPGNLGSMLRSADAAGAHGFFACGDSADLFHPRTVRAAMGSTFRLPAFRSETEPLLARLRDAGIRTVGADASGEVDYHRCDLTRPTALFFGNEGAGLQRELLAALDERVRVPMRIGVDSLSVGTAAGILLFDAARQRSVA